MNLSLRKTCLLLFAVSILQGNSLAQESLVPELASGAASGSSGYVAVGELQRIRRSDGTKRLALLNDAGEITAFVAPSARVNLREYVGQTIAVTARSVTHDVGKTPYIVPERATPLRGQGHEAPVVNVGAIGSGVRQASFSEPVASSVQPAGGQIIDEGYDSWEVLGGIPMDGMVMDGAVIDGGSGGSCHGGDSCGGCSSCAVSSCGGSCGFQCGGGCGTTCGSTCGPWGRIFVRGEYIAWWTKGMDIPPLVTTSPPGQNGVLPTAGILYGNEEILDESRSGFRIRFGGFLGPCRRMGWEMEYFGLGTERTQFEVASNGTGTPVIARPFFNVNPRNISGSLSPPARQDSELVASPGLLDGSVTVNSESTVDSAAGRIRWNFCCKKFACHDGCSGCGVPKGFSRFDLTFGYRYLGLNDSIAIHEALRALDGTNETFTLNDYFETENEFHGGEIGFMWEGGWRNLTLEVLSRMAIGNVEQRVGIRGDTTLANGSVSQTFDNGGLLAQSTNIGEYERDEFGMLNEFGLTLGLYLTPRLRATLGYTLIYLSPVVRAGDQISLDVNPDLLAPPISPREGADRPQFAFRETDFWANGLNVGLDLRW